MNHTIKQENFCLAYIETCNASEAYRRAYSAKNMSVNAVNVAANELTKNPKITLRLEELRKPVIQAAQITLEKHLNDLKTIRDLAQLEGKYSVAVAAEIARGRASGLYVENLNHSGSLAVGLPTIIIKKYDD